MKKTEKRIPWESLPDTLTAKQVCEVLEIPIRRVYELFKIHVDYGGIPTFQIGASIKVDKKDFKQWNDRRESNNSR
ncbi:MULTISPECIES: helix-turn-helix domain-containing protein [Bacillaceae]|uniref:Helix-turn-helix domain-containing protein n=1 Tax=Evansella alkalicola TaxID=745819 RepID=A0ABS6JYT1_9BACI|nr:MULTISPECIES: helix-turn-helix domain-containing protein [Bacillaceae]MBU9723648.1 helix-turn-helix domain-containing protein [Bacillus alkalicola]